MLQYCNDVVLQCCCAVVVQCYVLLCATVLQRCSAVVLEYCGIEVLYSQVSHKNSEGVLVNDYPMFHTAAALRSHLKNFVLETFKINLADPITFPKWNDWWKAYKGEVLKPNGKMKVSTRAH